MNKLDQFLSNVGDMALKRRAKVIIKELEIQEGDKILDAGCGPGFYENLLSQLYSEITIYGIDIDTKAIEDLKQRYKKRNSVKIAYADLMKKLPFRNNFFDKIIFSEVAEHVPDDLKALRELYRVLKPGGLVLITVPNHNYPFLWDPVNKILEKTTGRHIKSGTFAGIWTNHIRLYTREAIASVVKKAKFSIDKISTFTWWCLPFNHNLLYGGKLSKTTGEKVTAYLQKPSIVSKFIFGLLNVYDLPNSFLSRKNVGVEIFVKARKL